MIYGHLLIASGTAVEHFLTYNKGSYKQHFSQIMNIPCLIDVNDQFGVEINESITENTLPHILHMPHASSQHSFFDFP